MNEIFVAKTPYRSSRVHYVPVLDSVAVGVE